MEIHGAKRAVLRDTTPVLLVGNIEPAMAWYGRLGFEASYYPPGFAILRRDGIEIFLQHQPGYVRPPDAGRDEREAWDIYITTDDVKALFAEVSGMEGVRISRPMCEQEYGMVEFDVIDLNGYRLVFAQPVG